MVTIHIPAYLDVTETYCAGEYKAMEKLESERLNKMDPELRENGLIIPLVCRGS
jgi:hypothetical protein